jgi:4-amino-4-deoxy-L-arabinose transferase-like glycosyltransferase
VAFLEANRGDARFLLATLSARQAAPVIIRTGEPVAALGGFSGTDPIVTPQTLARMVDQKQVRFVMLGGARMNGFATTAGGADGLTAIEDWVRQHGIPIDPDLWRDYHPDHPAIRHRRRLDNAAPRPAPTELHDLAAAGNMPARGAN